MALSVVKFLGRYILPIRKYVCKKHKHTKDFVSDPSAPQVHLRKPCYYFSYEVISFFDNDPSAGNLLVTTSPME